MTVLDTVRSSLHLLTRRDRRVLGIVTLAQMSTALLDLVGVLLIGVVTALSLSVLGEVQLPSTVQTVVAQLGLSEVPTLNLAAMLACIAGLLLILKSLINIFLTRRILQFLANRQAMISGQLAAGLLARPLLQVQQRSSQETAYALTSGVNYATLSVLGQGIVAASETALLVILATGLLAISPIVTVFTVMYFLLVAIVIQHLLSGWASRLGSRASNAEVASYESIQEALRTYREAVVSDRRALYVNRFRGFRWQTAMVQSDMQFIGLIPKYVFEVALVIGAGLLAVSQLMTRDVMAAVAVIAVFLAAGSRVVPSMLRLQGAMILVRQAAGQAAPTYALARELNLDQGVTTPSHLGGIDAQELGRALGRGYPDFSPTVLVSDVWMTYPGARSGALEGVSISVPAGTSVALVGPTGAGKSTLADVILGVLNVDMGEVRIGGLSPKEAVVRWPGAIAYVPQEVVMANGTVMQNVALGLPLEAIDENLAWEALERAHLADYLRKSRQGLDTMVGEHGIKLSGGQRQRLGVARALYTRPKLLVLDEATSALDAETEKLIASTLRDLEGDVTTLTVAHRLATIRHCDLVVYMERGRVVSSGSFSEVRRTAPHFDEQARLLGL